MVYMQDESIENLNVYRERFMFKESKFQEKHVRILVLNEETCTCMKLRDNYLCFIMSFSGDHVS